MSTSEENPEYVSNFSTAWKLCGGVYLTGTVVMFGILCNYIYREYNRKSIIQKHSQREYDFSTQQSSHTLAPKLSNANESSSRNDVKKADVESGVSRSPVSTTPVAGATLSRSRHNSHTSAQKNPNDVRYECGQYMMNCFWFSRDEALGPDRGDRLLLYSRIATFGLCIATFIHLLTGSLCFLVDWGDNAPQQYPATWWSGVSWLAKLFVLGYDVGKTCLYLVCLFRIQLAYHGSSHKYPKRVTYALKFLILGFISVMGTCDIVYSKSEWWWLPKREKWFLQTITNSHFLMFQIVFDPLLIAIMLFLFNRPLRQLLQSHPSNSDNIQASTNYLRHVMIRYTFLTSCALITSFILIIFILLEMFALLSVLDVIVNVYCILLMSALYSDWYKVCCGRSHRWLGHNCCRMMAEEQSLPKENTNISKGRQPSKELQLAVIGCSSSVSASSGTTSITE